MIQVIGLDTTIARLAGIAVGSRRAVIAGADRGAEVVRERARERVRVDSGDLRDSIAITHDEDGATLVGSDSEYAAYIEFVIEAFLTPAADDAQADVIDAIDHEVQAVIGLA